MGADSSGKHMYAVGTRACGWHCGWAHPPAPKSVALVNLQRCVTAGTILLAASGCDIIIMHHPTIIIITGARRARLLQLLPAHVVVVVHQL